MEAEGTAYFTPLQLRHALRDGPARFQSGHLAFAHCTTAHCTLHSPSLAHVSSKVARLLERDARCEKEGETATKVHAQVMSGAEWCDSATNLPADRWRVSCSPRPAVEFSASPLQYGYGYGRDDGRPGFVANHVCFRPATAARPWAVHFFALPPPPAVASRLWLEEGRCA
ncbi:uncharacterized protein TrAtP1_005445 [Trichoderma atroviride]|uniref:uncharacterized protein n=1 Tax=Hypocrea atroviridis TaxID=63577 RepID=UPI0033211BA5|nr:hypothetical protein TrAtP1_005445 [Trichoderma atroviride]